ncbi:hypothetical protein CALCODRAFT_498073 [Calocera cornea HHB12733]|uniref:Uncharacterized protein n=1 Tax=Calocera cornea HHB12733 TaxID=1353952 RepID=A0A165EZN0_9BASI|nr:hypothetical protein CALCODRAFT_498073 [Calocera cornea HHB12733]
MPQVMHSRPSSRKPSPSSLSTLSGVSQLSQISEEGSQKTAVLALERAHAVATVRREQRERAFVDPNANFFVRKWLLFESTFALSMLEPWEKVLVLALCFFLVALLATGVFRYLPFHLQFINRRTRFYILGDEHAPLSAVATLVGARWL